MLPQRIDARRGFQHEGPPLISAGEPAGDEPTVTEKIAGGHAGGVVSKNVRPGATGIEAQVRQDPPAHIATGGPAIAPQHAVEGLRAVVKMLVAAEHADQKVGRDPVRDAGKGIDLYALEIAAGRGAIEIGAADIDPGEPSVDRDRGRRRLGPHAAVAGVAERGETVRDAFFAAVWRYEEAVEIALLRVRVRARPSVLLCLLYRALLYRALSHIALRCGRSRNLGFERLERVDEAGAVLRIDAACAEMLGGLDQKGADVLRLERRFVSDQQGSD